jgi:hypothetical protein
LVARERAATLRVRFDATGTAQVSGGRQLGTRQTGELGRLLETEARSCGATWVLVIVSLGWQAEIGRRAARSPEDQTKFERHRIAQEAPELLVAQAHPERVYAAVDHPDLDRSIVFSCKRRELETLVQEVEAAGLGLAGIRLGVASQFEYWLQANVGRALTSDILVSDGMSVLLVNTCDGDFCSPPSEKEAAPRQASSRPNDAAQDGARFVRDNEGRPCVFLGPEEFMALLVSRDGAFPEIQLLRPEEPRLHDPALAALSPQVLHDFNPRFQHERPALSPLWRRALVGTGFTVLAMGLCCAALAWNAVDDEAAASRASESARATRLRQEQAALLEKEMERDRDRALELREWLLSGYHAQSFAYRLLSSVPEDVCLDQVFAKLDESSPQLSLEFTLRGAEEARVRALRGMERCVLSLGFRVGERRSLSANPSSGYGHRWRLILPTGQEGALP